MKNHNQTCNYEIVGTLTTLALTHPHNYLGKQTLTAFPLSRRPDRRIKLLLLFYPGKSQKCLIPHLTLFLGQKVQAIGLMQTSGKPTMHANSLLFNHIFAETKKKSKYKLSAYTDNACVECGKSVLTTNIVWQHTSSLGKE